MHNNINGPIEPTRSRRIGLASGAGALLCIFALPAVASICPATNNSTDCTVTGDPNVYECTNGYLIEFLGKVFAGGNSTFSYKVTGPGVAGGRAACRGVNSVSHITYAFDLCLGTDEEPLILVSTTPGGELLLDGKGDNSTGFCKNVFDAAAFKFNLGVQCESMKTFSLTYQGNVPVEIADVLLKTGAGEFLAMLPGPGCGATSIELAKSCNAAVTIDNDGRWITYSYDLDIENTGSTDVFDCQVREDTPPSSGTGSGPFFGADCVIVSGADFAGNTIGSAWVDTDLVGALAPGSTHTVEIECMSMLNDLQNQASAQCFTQDGMTVPASATVSPVCGVNINSALDLTKNCNTARLMQHTDIFSDQVLVVEICSDFSVTNSGNEAILDITITDPLLNDGSAINVGDLNAGASTTVDVGGSPLVFCYLPSVSNSPTFGDGKYCAHDAMFPNQANASGFGKISQATVTAAPASATCDLSSAKCDSTP